MSVSHMSYRWGDPKKLAARLNRRITIQEPQETADEAGGVVRGWSDVATVWAEVEPQRSGGNEALFAGQLEKRGTHRITIRYRSGLHAGMRVTYGARVFNIRHIANINEANVLLVLDAEEGVAT